MFLTSPSTSVPAGWLAAKLSHGLPWHLLQAQRDAALVGVDVQHHHLDLLRGGDDLARMHVLLGPAHLGDVDQALDPRLELDEGAVVGDVGHAAGELGADRVLDRHRVPRVGLQLLHAEADALGVLVDLDDLHLERLADRDDLGGVVDAPPRHIGDVQEAVDAAEVHERAVIGDVLDHALDDIAFLELGDDLGALLGTAFLEDRAAADDDVAAAAVHLEDLERLGHAHQRADIAHGAHVDLAAGQERHGAAEVDGEAALDAAEDRALDAVVLLVGLLEAVPRLLAARLVAADHRLAAGVLDPLEEDLDLVADADLGRLAGAGEFLEVDAAFNLEADVDDRLAVLDRDHLALDDRALVGRVVLEALLKQGLEVFHRCRSWHLFS